MAFITSLDPSSPDPEDAAGLVFQEVRNLKQCFQDQFEGEAGTDEYDIAVTVGPRTLNTIPDKVDGEDFDALENRVSQEELATANQATTNASLDTRLDSIEAAGYVTAAQAMAACWPVGSLFISADGGTPTAKGLPGTWVSVGSGRVLLGTTAGATGGSMSKTLSEANLPEHRHLMAADETLNNDALNASNEQVAKADTVGGGGNGYRLGGTSTEATLGRTSAVGSGTAIDITPAYLGVTFYQRTA